MREPLVSIIVPCYKQAEYIAETLDSVLAQTYCNWECVIVNDGSPDNTEDIVAKYIAVDDRFKYFWKENEGVAKARNYGVMNSMGEYVLPLDADDLIEPTYVEKAVDWFHRFPKTKLVYCCADRFGTENGYWNLEPYEYEKFIWRNCIFCTAMYRRTDFNQTGGYNANMIYGDEDWDFLLSLLKKNDEVHRIEELLFHYRIKNESRTTESARPHVEESLIQIYRNHPDVYFPYLDRIIYYHNYSEDYDNIIGTNSALQKELKRIQLSHAYRLGKFILKPLSWLKVKVCVKKYNE